MSATSAAETAEARGTPLSRLVAARRAAYRADVVTDDPPQLTRGSASVSYTHLTLPTKRIV